MKALCGVLALVVATTALAARSSRDPWRPSMGAAISYASHRHGVIAFAVRTPTRS